MRMNIENMMSYMYKIIDKSRKNREIDKNK